MYIRLYDPFNQWGDLELKNWSKPVILYCSMSKGGCKIGYKNAHKENETVVIYYAILMMRILFSVAKSISTESCGNTYGWICLKPA